MTITVSTDGSALGNPNGPMGWAWADHELNMAHSGGHEHGGDCDAVKKATQRNRYAAAATKASTKSATNPATKSKV